MPRRLVPENERDSLSQHGAILHESLTCQTREIMMKMSTLREHSTLPLLLHLCELNSSSSGGGLMTPTDAVYVVGFQNRGTILHNLHTHVVPSHRWLLAPQPPPTLLEMSTLLFTSCGEMKHEMTVERSPQRARVPYYCTVHC